MEYNGWVVATVSWPNCDPDHTAATFFVGAWGEYRISAMRTAFAALGVSLASAVDLTSALRRAGGSTPGTRSAWSSATSSLDQTLSSRDRRRARRSRSPGFCPGMIRGSLAMTRERPAGSATPPYPRRLPLRFGRLRRQRADVVERPLEPGFQRRV